MIHRGGQPGSIIFKGRPLNILHEWMRKSSFANSSCIHTYTHTHAHIHTYICTYIHVHEHPNWSACIHTPEESPHSQFSRAAAWDACIHVYIHLEKIHIRKFLIQKYIHTFTHTDMYAYTGVCHTPAESPHSQVPRAAARDSGAVSRCGKSAWSPLHTLPAVPQNTQPVYAVARSGGCIDSHVFFDFAP